MAFHLIGPASVVRFIPARVSEPDGPRFTATAPRMMDESILVWHDDPELGAKLAADAGAIFGGGVLLALQDMQQEGKLPPPGSPCERFAWRLDDAAAAGDPFL